MSLSISIVVTERGELRHRMEQVVFSILNDWEKTSTLTESLMGHLKFSFSKYPSLTDPSKEAER